MTDDGAISRVTDTVQHYGTADLLNRLRAALTKAGLDEKLLAPADLASFLVTPLGMRALLEEQGFRIVDWADRTGAGLAWFAELQKARAQTSGTLPPLGLHVAIS
jgi:hypothetical protein